MSHATMTALIAARMEMKQVERNNAPVRECEAALDRLAEVVGMHAAMKYQSAVRLMLQLEYEQCGIVDAAKA